MLRFTSCIFLSLNAYQYKGGAKKIIFGHRLQNVRGACQLAPFLAEYIILSAEQRLSSCLTSVMIPIRTSWSALMLTVMAVTVLLFGLIYALIYKLTANAYFSIVSGGRKDA